MGEGSSSPGGQQAWAWAAAQRGPDPRGEYKRAADARARIPEETIRGPATRREFASSTKTQPFWGEAGPQGPESPPGKP